MSPTTSRKPARRNNELLPRAPRKTPAISSAQMSELIGSIYDCVLAPSEWEGVLRDICRAFSFELSIFGVFRLGSDVQTIEAAVGVEPEWLRRVPEYQQDVIDVWGGVERIMQYPLDEPVILSRAMSPVTIRENRYFREWAQPQGLTDAIAIIVARNSSIVGNMGFSRHELAPPLGDADVDGLRQLAPHIRRSVTISDLFDMKAIEAATLGSVLDSFAFGIVLVDEHLGIVHSNRTAQGMLAARDPVRSERGALTVTEPASHAAIQRAVRDAAGDQAHLGAKGIGVPVHSADGASFVIHVLPINRGEMRRGLGQRASVALFVAPAMASRRTHADVLAVLYDLTPAEARVLELLVAGMTQTAIGTALGIAPSTVKSHVLHLFDKTGCRRQVDLVRLASNLSLPV